MAMAVVDIQPVRAIDEAEALRVSNKIDEELKVSHLQPLPALPRLLAAAPAAFGN